MNIEAILELEVTDRTTLHMILSNRIDIGGDTCAISDKNFNSLVNDLILWKEKVKV